MSLSVRRAWIEIHSFPLNDVTHGVALRKESVDRNNSLESKQIDPSVSLSVRRAWIEMHMCHTIDRVRAVALRKESVDRNTFFQVCTVARGVALRKESVDRN